MKKEQNSRESKSAVNRPERGERVRMYLQPTLYNADSLGIIITYNDIIIIVHFERNFDSDPAKRSLHPILIASISPWGELLDFPAVSCSFDGSRGFDLPRKRWVPLKEDLYSSQPKLTNTVVTRPICSPRNGEAIQLTCTNDSFFVRALAHPDIPVRIIFSSVELPN